MKKQYPNIFTNIFAVAIIFFVGFFTARFLFQTDKMHHTNIVNGSVSDSLKKTIFPEVSEHAPTLRVHSNDITNENDYALSNSDKKLLKRHLFGQWRFVERLVSLDDRNNNHYNKSSNISDVGVEELKKNLIISFEEDWIDYEVKINQSSLSNARDMFFFGLYGGFQSIRNPVFKIIKRDSDVLDLFDMYNSNYYQKTLWSGSGDYYAVSYFVPKKEHDTPEIYSKFFASPIYIDPTDENIIYVEFCGLWKMKRDDSNYGTGGKSPY